MLRLLKSSRGFFLSYLKIKRLRFRRKKTGSSQEGNPGDWYMWQTGKYYGRWLTAGESVEYSATFSGRDFIAGVDRQKTEMVDGIACGNCGIICYRD